MIFELSKYNTDKVKKVLGGVQGKNIMVNDTWLHGVASIDVTECETFDSDPEEGYDGGKRDLINIAFNFENGNVAHSFCPDEEHCEIRFETDELWIFSIEDIKQYIERKQGELAFQLKEYEEYISK